MAQSIEDWLNSDEIKEIQKKKITPLLTQTFFRDPMRPLYYNPSAFYSPADGIVLYAHKRIGPTEKIVEVKGKKFTVQDLLYDKTYQNDSLVIGIFMTVLDVHINRMPTNGLVSDIMETPFIYTHNTSMYPFEQSLLNDLHIDHSKLNYLFQNEKAVSTIYCPEIRGEYYLVQIADKDVNALVQFAAESDYLSQGERYGTIRWGSQVDCIIPLLDNRKADYKILAKVGTHIQGGVDKIIQIIERKNDNSRKINKRIR